MLDLIVLLVGLAGFAAAGYWDLKTTEFPDWLPYGMIASIILARSVFGFFAGDFSGLFSSMIAGCLLLGFGLLLYLLKQWGDGDAWLLGVLGLMLPNSFIKISGGVIPVYISLLLNFFLIAFAYIIIYSLAIGVLRSDVRKLFFKKINGESRRLLPFSVGFPLAYFAFMFYINSIGGITPRSLLFHISFPFLMVFIAFFMSYSEVIEKIVFRKRINIKDLKVGDVVIGSRWRGLTENQIKKLKISSEYVWIKEGVRFAPVFLITLLASIFLGSLIG